MTTVEPQRREMDCVDHDHRGRAILEDAHGCRWIYCPDARGYEVAERIDEVVFDAKRVRFAATLLVTDPLDDDALNLMAEALGRRGR